MGSWTLPAIHGSITHTGDGYDMTTRYDHQWPDTERSSVVVPRIVAVSESERQQSYEQDPNSSACIEKNLTCIVCVVVGYDYIDGTVSRQDLSPRLVSGRTIS